MALERVCMKISDTTLLNNPTYFTNPSIFMGKIWPSLFFSKNSENSMLFFIKEGDGATVGGFSYALAFLS